MPLASIWLTAVSAHERASTIPKLHRANTMAWGLLKWGRCVVRVRSHWSKPAWQNIASLLAVVGHGTSHSMPLGGKLCHVSQKPPLMRGEGGEGLTQFRGRCAR